MTAEEIEIIVDASVEKAVKEFEKILPAIKQQVQKIVEHINKADFSSISGKVQQVVKQVKQKMQDLKKSNENNKIAIKVSSSDAKKEVTQLEKQIDSLQAKINARQMKLNVITPQLDSITNKTMKEVTPNGISSSSPAMQETIGNALNGNKDYKTLSAQENKLISEISTYNKLLSEAKGKMSQLKQEVSNTATSQNKLTSFFSAFKGKIDQAKTATGGLKNAFNQMPKVTKNISSNIQKMSGGVKQGLGQVLKYAGALFSLRSIYSMLSSSANSWLSSQNAGAKQLSANINYMKYAMRKCSSTSNTVGN